MRRHDDPPACASPDQVGGKVRGSLDIDILGAERRRRLEHATTLLFTTREAAALPARATRDDDRRTTAMEGAGDVRAVDEVEAQLDEIGVGRGIPVATEIIHRRSRDGHTELWFSHHQSRNTGQHPAENEKAPSARG